MNFENIDMLMGKYSLLLQIRYHNGNSDNKFLENEILVTKQRLIAQQVPQEIIEPLEECYKIK